MISFYSHYSRFMHLTHQYVGIGVGEVEREVAEDILGGGWVALYGGLVGAAEVKVLQEDTGHRRKAKEVGVDVEQPLVPGGRGRGRG